MSSMLPVELPGWTRLSAETVRTERSRHDLAPFFEGAAPDIATVLNPDLSPLTFSAALIQAVGTRIDKRIPGISLLRGPSGEGKSTALLQAGISLARTYPELPVYVRESPDVVTSVDDIVDVVGGGHGAVLIADGAESMIDTVGRYITRLHPPTIGDVQFLLAARLTDWSKAQRQRKLHRDPAEVWAQSTFDTDVFDLGGPIEAGDAEVIAGNWAACGGLTSERLTGRTPEQLVSWLQKASTDSRNTTGAMLGALLQVRLGPAGLRARIASVLDDLRDTVLPSSRDLADVLVVLAATDFIDLDGLDRGILAQFAGVERLQVPNTIEEPLGREAVAGSASVVLHVRHRIIAHEVVRQAVASDGYKFACALADLVTATTVQGDTDGYRPGHGKVKDIGRALERSRSLRDVTDLDRGSLVEACISAARRSVEVNPTTLSARVALSSLLRENDRAQRAISEVWGSGVPALDDRRSWHDWADMVRSAWSEASVSCSVAGYHRSALRLAAVSISDRADMPGLGLDRIAVGLNGVCWQATQLHTTTGERRWSELVSTLVGVAERKLPAVGPFLTNYAGRYCAEVGVEPDLDVTVDRAIMLLAQIVQESDVDVDTPWLTAALDSTDTAFVTLRGVLHGGHAH